MKYLLVTAGLVLCLALNGAATAATIGGLVYDTHVWSPVAGDGPSFPSPPQRPTTVHYEDETALRVGAGGGSADQNYVAILVFQLPAIAATEQFANVQLDFSFVATLGTVSGFNVDLYSAGVRDSEFVSRNDYFIGSFGTDATSATPLADNVLTSATATGAVSSAGGVGAGATTLTGYLNDYYAADSAAAGKYLFLRLNPDTDPPDGSNAYFVGAIENGDGLPTLNFDLVTVPEPGLASAAGAALLALARRRRRST